MKAKIQRVNERGYFDYKLTKLTPIEAIKVLQAEYNLLTPLNEQMNSYLWEESLDNKEEREMLEQAQKIIENRISFILSEVQTEYKKLLKIKK